MFSKLFAISLSAVTAALLAGCATEAPPQPKSTASEYTPSHASWAPSTSQRPAAGSELGSPMPISRSDKGMDSLVIDERIMSACNIVPAAFFGFDSDAVEPNQVLDRLADCFVSGPLAGHKLRIIGHADPRGERYHNLVLGQKRATAVAYYLNARGFDLLNVHTMTVGSKEAVGTDEDGWALDRKVELFLEGE